MIENGEVTGFSFANKTYKRSAEIAILVREAPTGQNGGTRAPPCRRPGSGSAMPPRPPGAGTGAHSQQKARPPKRPPGLGTKPRVPPRVTQRPGNQLAGNTPNRPIPGAKASVFRFESFSARVHSGAAVAPNLSSHPNAKTYQTRLRNDTKGGGNFAGEYILATWGCGGQCLMGAAINARTGSLHFLPGTICCWFELGEEINPMDYRADGNLIIFNGLVNEEDPMAKHFYEFRGGKFRLLQQQAVSSVEPANGSKEALVVTSDQKTIGPMRTAATIAQ